MGDEAFPLNRYLLQPYSGKHLDKEKCAFNYRPPVPGGWWGARLGSLLPSGDTECLVSPKVADAVMQAACILHNFLRWEEADE